MRRQGILRGKEKDSSHKSVANTEQAKFKTGSFAYRLARARTCARGRQALRRIASRRAELFEVS